MDVKQNLTLDSAWCFVSWWRYRTTDPALKKKLVIHGH
jgi:hypothetical protein